MAIGHIQIGAPGALREYPILPNTYQAGNANPMAARITTGGEFDQIDAWEEWVMDDWQAGVARKDALAGGFLYGEVESRFRKKLFLSTPVYITSSTPMPDGLTTYETEEQENTIDVGTGETYQKVSTTFRFTANDTIHGIWLYLQSDTTDITIDIYDEDPGGTGSIISTETLTPDAGRPGNYWFYSSLSSPVTTTGTPNFEVHAVIYPTTGGQTITVPVSTSITPVEQAKYYNGSSWVNLDNNYVFKYLDLEGKRMGDSPNNVSGVSIISFNNEIYVAYYDQLYKFDGPDDWNSVGSSRSAAITSLAVYGANLYIGQGNADNLDSMNTSETYSDEGVQRNLLKVWGGYLWGTDSNNLYYYNGSTWSSAIQVGPSDYEIRGLAGNNEFMYVSTDDALWYIADGDIAVEILRYDTVDSVNGENMIAGEDGALYVPLRNRLIRVDPSGTAQDIWIDRDEDLPSTRIGDIQSVIGVYGQIWATVEPADTSTDPSTVWAWNRQGWHHVATVPVGMGIGVACLDTTNLRVWITTDIGYAIYVGLPAIALNPLQDSTFNYRPTSFVEWDKFWGGQRKLDKDWESVYITGDNLASGVEIDVYWQDVDSTDWELLGTIDSDGEELRWSTYGTRPNGKWIKLGLLLKTNDVNTTPVIEGVVVKYIPMISDRLRWSFVIPVHDNVELADGDLNAYTGAQQKSHLESMLLGRVHPFIFEDVDDTQYEAKVVEWSRRLSKSEYFNGALQNQFEYSLVLEQVTDSTYA